MAPSVSRIGERRGYTIDLNAGADTRGVSCPDDLVGTPLLASPPDVGGGSWALPLRAGESARIVLANGSRGRTIALVGTVRGGEAALRAWMAKAQPVIDSITFAPCTFTHVAYRACEDLGTSSP